MAAEQHAFLHLGCVPCRRVHTIAAHAADVVAGRSGWDEYRKCPRCGKEMTETAYGDCGHILLPGEDCNCRGGVG